MSLPRNHQLIENDFVEERKRDKSVTQHDLTMKITIARYDRLSLALCLATMTAIGSWVYCSKWTNSALNCGNGRRSLKPDGKRDSGPRERHMATTRPLPQLLRHSSMSALSGWPGSRSWIASGMISFPARTRNPRPYNMDSSVINVLCG